ncbi:TetR family transcriptional regulator [Bosea sp. Root381]|jgi:AcrR family transcriptional regulator|uniref:TetR/AcrR family transcriptional regulator n=1 Tax=Bosea sp. Root381 TaxID=1736524 RepID=UPI0006F88240|nr:TetR/AcrR family transcriptional regulator [Bosea sp. Root381]KRE17994.1 TetR family transcriptional regulator [Bosea sp. Root381]
MQKTGGPDSGAGAGQRTRGRPRGFDRDSALETATRLFWRKGYAATSVSDLTEAMGIGSPSLYAAFGSKEGLYAEALRHYGERYEALVWGNFRAAATAREAVRALLMDSAAALTGSCGANDPLGCMVTLSAVGSEGHAELGERVRMARHDGLMRIEERLSRAVAEGELPPGSDVAGLARLFVAVQAGMSILARDGASRAELEAAALHAMQAWPKPSEG